MRWRRDLGQRYTIIVCTRELEMTLFIRQQRPAKERVCPPSCEFLNNRIYNRSQIFNFRWSFEDGYAQVGERQWTCRDRSGMLDVSFETSSVTIEDPRLWGAKFLSRYVPILIQQLLNTMLISSSCLKKNKDTVYIKKVSLETHMAHELTRVNI